jgi:large subunit ribosomal protein L6
MSRVANSPVALPSGVEVKLSGQDISVKGAKGEMGFAIHDLVELVQEESELKVRAKSEERGATAMAGTMRAIVQNMVKAFPKDSKKS